MTIDWSPVTGAAAAVSAAPPASSQAVQVDWSADRQAGPSPSASGSGGSSSTPPSPSASSLVGQ